jgi:spore maturation protein SpmA
MAGTPRYTAVLDANVLYLDLLRDILMSLAMAVLYSAKWSEHIHQEWMSNLKANRLGIGTKSTPLGR